MASLDDVVVAGRDLNTGLRALTAALQAAFPRITGTATLANATTTVVVQPAVKANSLVLFSATNSSAALLMRTQGLWHSANVAGASFSLSTQTGTASGVETVEYILVSPS